MGPPEWLSGIMTRASPTGVMLRGGGMDMSWFDYEVSECFRMQ